MTAFGDDIEHALVTSLRALRDEPLLWHAALHRLVELVRIARDSGEAANDPTESTAPNGQAPLRLSAAEVEVVHGLADGLRADEIATLRGASVHTVRNQIKSAMAKTGARRQAELVAIVLRGTR